MSSVYLARQIEVQKVGVMTNVAYGFVESVDWLFVDADAHSDPRDEVFGLGRLKGQVGLVLVLALGLCAARCWLRCWRK
jgi:hypothetical protein